MAALPEYVWLMVVGVAAAFGFGWGTGANDVANAFATSVGSKTLTLRNAVILAGIFEFTGALVLGRVSTNTIASGIADITAFERDPEVYAYGMVCALTVGTVWLIFTSYLGLNVSSTHTIISGIIGFAFVWDGPNAVTWFKKDSEALIRCRGVVTIVLSWFVAPIFTGTVAAMIFLLVRTVVLRREKAYDLAFWTLPPCVLITVWINLYFICTKGVMAGFNWSNATALWISAIASISCTLLTIFLGLPILRKMAGRHFDSEGKPISLSVVPVEDSELQAVATATADIEGDTAYMEGAQAQAHSSNHAVVAPESEIEPAEPSWLQVLSNAATHGMHVDIHDIVQTNAAVQEIHDAAEKFEPRVEYAFSYLQVFSAICVITAHGAGEVGYMAGPLTTIWDVYQKGELSKTVKPPLWVVVIGAGGLVVGLATYGYNVTRAMGVKLAKITPARGFAAELATSLVIVIASQYGLPTSSSQCITGAIIGVGLAESSKGVNWKQFFMQVASWVSTLLVIGSFVGMLFAQGVYAPSKISGREIAKYEDRITKLSIAMYSEFYTSLVSYEYASNGGYLEKLPGPMWIELNNTVSTHGKDAKILSGSQSMDADRVLNMLYHSLSLYQNFTVFTLGQKTVYPGAIACKDPASTRKAKVACRPPQLLPADLIQ